MNPETVKQNAVLTETIHLDPNATPEEVQAAVQKSVEKMQGLVAQGETKDAPAEVVNPYADRVFKATEQYPGRKRAIVLYPDRKLEEVSAEVVVFDPQLARLAADLVSTATATDAAGLSAIQVGEAVRMCVIRISKDAGQYVVLVNPTVHPHEHTKTQMVTEGCLSFPGVTEKVQRDCRVNVKYQDLDGKHRQMTLTIDNKATFVAAQAAQHEVEHLDGKLLLGSLNIVHRDRIRTHMKQVHRKLDTIFKKSGKQYGATQVLFGYIPDPEPKTAEA